MTNHTRLAASLLVLPLALGACERQGSSSAGATPPTATPTAPAAHAASTPAPPGASAGEVHVAGITVPIPEGWSQVPPANSMRLAELSAPGDPEPCEVAFSTAGGSVEANVGRWAMQMTDASGNPLSVPEIATREVGGLTVHTVEMTGTYLGMRAAPPKPDTMLRAAIVETASGLVFIKMTGPATAMNANATGWATLIDGLHAG